jgi:hypothetical protein
MPNNNLYAAHNIHPNEVLWWAGKPANKSTQNYAYLNAANGLADISATSITGPGTVLCQYSKHLFIFAFEARY